MKRILIANRGEIACRVIRTCEALGIESIAVFSDADRGALHTRRATAAVRIGPGDARLSYLNIERVVAAAVENGCDGVHPGYGFLSERPEFAEAVRAAGLTFIGPSPESMRALGDKVAAKKLAAEAGVPLVPGVFLESPAATMLADATAFIAEAGLPVLVKAAAGGGGRGMRVVSDVGSLEALLDSARREAESSFGDGRVFIEKLVSPARHVEVQILGDARGDAVHLFDRDCSLQRNHQKIIEEAPAFDLPLETRKLMYDSAVALAKRAGYAGAGTVEFLVDSEYRPYFLEVNSRLQVEHPVTETITGLDLVEMQIRIASGESLETMLSDHWILDAGLSDDLIDSLGSAVEARICAESYHEGRFLPATGTISTFTVPTGWDGPRTDSGVEIGSVVSHHYDSLIAKVIAAGDSREEAIASLRLALSETKVAGVRNNLGLLMSLLDSVPFLLGDHHTSMLANLLPTDTERAERACRFALERALHDSANDLRAFRVFGSASRATDYESDGIQVTIELSDNRAVARSGAVTVSALAHDGDPRACLIDDFVCTRDGCVEVRELPRSMGRTGASGRSESGIIRSPLPGRIAALAKREGDEISEGEIVMTLESMKMEHPLRASRSGRILKIHAAPGAAVEARSIVAEIG